MKNLFYLTLSLLLCQCSTINKEQCEKGEWQKIGLIDGENGRSANYISLHEQSCPISEQEKVGYQNARILGLIQFCTYQGGFNHGSLGQDYTPTCQNINEKEFKEAYLKGRNIYLLRQRKNEIKAMREEKEEEIKNDKSVLNHATQVYNFISGRSPTDKLNSEEAKVSDEIYKIESTLPAEISSNRYNSFQNTNMLVNSLGAFAGTFIGFGVGHAIQGRYSKTGWKWTLTEVASLTSIAVAASNSPCNEVNQSTNAQDNCSDPLSFITGVTFVGLRVWQSVNLWSHISSSEYEPSYQVSLTPRGVYLLGQF